jgi:hypothetical protein
MSVNQDKKLFTSEAMMAARRLNLMALNVAGYPGDTHKYPQKLLTMHNHA